MKNQANDPAVVEITRNEFESNDPQRTTPSNILRRDVRWLATENCTYRAFQIQLFPWSLFGFIQPVVLKYVP